MTANSASAIKKSDSVKSEKDARWYEPRSAYFHVPFCAHRCGYCDFASVAGQDELADAYLDALEAEVAKTLDQPHNADTIFIGGGTPTYLSPAQLDRLLTRVRHWFPPQPGQEFTVESNPNTLDEEKIATLAAHGVTRVSLGAQSFEPELLARLERNHDPDSVSRAIAMLRPRIAQVSIDLIFGIPGQTFEQWDADLRRALELGTDHLSLYGLTYEKGTRLWRQRQLAIVTPVDEEVERQMMEHAIDVLSSNGYCHYEISNFARASAGEPPRHCRHNLAYWANHAYFGFGTGAAAYRHYRRTLNIRDVAAYIARMSAGRDVVTQSESLEPEARARETAMLNLRRMSGLDRATFQCQTDYSIDELAGRALARHVADGLLEDTGTGLRLTREGLLLADAVLQSVL